MWSSNQRSSWFRKKTKRPLASSMPRLLGALCSPQFDGRFSHRTRLSPIAWRTSSVSSVQASPTTTTSRSWCVWRSAETTAHRSRAELLNAAITTETFGGFTGIDSLSCPKPEFLTSGSERTLGRSDTSVEPQTSEQVSRRVADVLATPADTFLIGP